MGIYLAQPCTVVEIDVGGSDDLDFAVGSMQGWRMNMEDAHIAFPSVSIDLRTPRKIALFGVFDGHGGKEVAKFAQLRYRDELYALEAFKKEEFEIALKQSFHKIDALLEDTENESLLKRFKSYPNPSDEDYEEWKANVLKNGESGGEVVDALPSSDVNADGDKKKSDIRSRSLDLLKKLAAKKPGQVCVDPPGDEQNADTAVVVDGTESGSESAGVVPFTLERPPPSTQTACSVNREMVCRLAPHRVTAGCTAVVALKVDNILYVANAGDSRAVLCRADGTAHELSLDHKPGNVTELQRIEAAGGFVNAVGRVNGNLNLSRSLGDLKYKQVPNVPKEGQIITAEPDVTSTELHSGDKFIILACDGIWDCMTSQSACDFVSLKLSEGLKPADIVREVFRISLAEDSRSAGGVGTDNMTFSIVLLRD